MAEKISENEKETALILYKAGKNVSEISTVLKRSSASIAKIVDKFKEENPTEIVEKEYSPETGKHWVSKAVIEDTVYSLTRQGINVNQARKAVEQTLPHLREYISTKEDLLKIVAKFNNINELTVNESLGGRKGITIMTEAASSKADDIIRSSTPDTSQYIFNPKG